MSFISNIEGDLKAFEQSSLQKLRLMIDNHLTSYISEVPQFTSEEIAYLESDAAKDLNIPPAVITLLSGETTTLSQAVDLFLIKTLTEVKALIDSKLANAAVTASVVPQTSCEALIDAHKASPPLTTPTGAEVYKDETGGAEPITEDSAPTADKIASTEAVSEEKIG